MIAGALNDSGMALGGKLFYAALSDTGPVRDHNEDGFLCDPALGLFAVADGMGGANAGEVASKLALEVLHERVRAARVPADGLWVGLDTANAAVWNQAQRIPSERGMGTTLSALVFAGRKIHGAHVGDSRIYRFRGGTLEQLTEDHTLFNEYVQKGLVKPDQEVSFRNVITRAIGTKNRIEIDTFEEDGELGDLFLIASDGLEALSPHQIAGCLRGHTQDRQGRERRVVRLSDMLDDLVGSALKSATDNVTAVLIRVEAT